MSDIFDSMTTEIIYPSRRVTTSKYGMDIIRDYCTQNCIKYEDLRKYFSYIDPKQAKENEGKKNYYKNILYWVDKRSYEQIKLMGLCPKDLRMMVEARGCADSYDKERCYRCWEMALNIEWKIDEVEAEDYERYL